MASTNNSDITSPSDLTAIGQLNKFIRRGRFDVEESRQNRSYAKLPYHPTSFEASGQWRSGGTELSADITILIRNIAYSVERAWHGKALQLFGLFCNDLLNQIRSRGGIRLKYDLLELRNTLETSWPEGTMTTNRDALYRPILLEKRGKQSMESFEALCVLTRLTELHEVAKFLRICNQNELIAEKIHIRTVLTMFADLPALFCRKTPVSVFKLLGSGGQRTIFMVRTQKGERYALRPDTRRNELEKMFVCLETMAASHLCHIYAAPEYSNVERNFQSRHHLFMPVMMESDRYFTHQRLKEEPCQLLIMVRQVTRQMLAMDEDGSIHRDVKPANILIYFDENKPSDPDLEIRGNPCFFLTDFGWSCNRGTAHPGLSVGGTKQYRDPFMYVYPPDPRNDIWCLALAVLFLVNRATERQSRGSIVKRVKAWQEKITASFMELYQQDQRFGSKDFARWRVEWAEMATGAPLKSPRAFMVGNSEITARWAEFMCGALSCDYEKRWSSRRVLEWCDEVAQEFGWTEMLVNSESVREL